MRINKRDDSRSGAVAKGSGLSNSKLEFGLRQMRQMRRCAKEVVDEVLSFV